jgi:hypothetical protein
LILIVFLKLRLMFSSLFGSTMAKDVSEPPKPVPSVPQHITTSPETTSSVFSTRSLKQLGLFFAGAGFLTVSTLITRRSVARKQIAAFPKFYQPSHRPAFKGENAEGSLIAVEALGLATLNVVSFGIMATGGLSWAFDVSSVEDLRSMARRHVGLPGGEADEAAEKEIEEWFAKMLSKKGRTFGDSKPETPQAKSDDRKQ